MSFFPSGVFFNTWYFLESLFKGIFTPSLFTNTKRTVKVFRVENIFAIKSLGAATHSYSADNSWTRGLNTRSFKSLTAVSRPLWTAPDCPPYRPSANVLSVSGLIVFDLFFLFVKKFRLCSRNLRFVSLRQPYKGCTLWIVVPTFITKEIFWRRRTGRTQTSAGSWMRVEVVEVEPGIPEEVNGAELSPIKPSSANIYCFENFYTCFSVVYRHAHSMQQMMMRM